MVEKPFAFLPLVWTFVPNAFPQQLQNLTVKLAIDSLTRGYEFLVDSALDVENAKGLLVVAQQSWHKSRRNASHVQIVRQNALNSPV
jgi:hypothetical protein